MPGWHLSNTLHDGRPAPAAIRVRARLPHRVELRGTTLADGRAMPARSGLRFAGAEALPLGRQAVLHVAARAICVDRSPASGSGTADRYAQVTRVLEPFGPRPVALQLPSLFGARLGVTREASGRVGFLAAALRRAEGDGEPQGVDFTPWSVAAGAFRRAGPLVRTSFVEPGDVFRFTVGEATAR